MRLLSVNSLRFMEQENKRIEAYIHVRNSIKSCFKQSHLKGANRMVSNYEKRYGNANDLKTLVRITALKIGFTKN